MKTFSGTFANGQKYMGVEKREDAKYDLWNEVLCTNNELTSIQGIKSILGTYQTKGGFDFEAPHGAVSEFQDKNLGLMYHIEPTESITLHKTKYDALLSLLDRDSRMAFPLEENPYGGKPEYLKTGAFDEATTNQQIINIWREAESQVRPKSFLIILIK